MKHEVLVIIIAKQRIYISLILNYCNQDFYIIIFVGLFVKTRRRNSMHTIIITICFVFVLFEALRLSQQVFSHVGKEPPLPGYYQYFVVFCLLFFFFGGGGKCILLKIKKLRPN